MTLNHIHVAYCGATDRAWRLDSCGWREISVPLLDLMLDHGATLRPVREVI